MSMMKWPTYFDVEPYMLIEFEFVMEYDFYLPFIWMEIMDATMIYWGSDESTRILE